MIKSLLALLSIIALYPDTVFAQLQDTLGETRNDTLYTVGQESIPPNDSGGRWIETTILLKSESSFPVFVYGFPIKNYSSNRTCAPNFDFFPSDSAWLLADSIMTVIEDFSGHKKVAFGTPWKYKDSLPALQPGQYYGEGVFQYMIPPRGTLRIPYYFQAIGSDNFSRGDTVNIGDGLFPGWDWGSLNWFSDSVVGNTVYRLFPQYQNTYAPPIYALAPSSAPYCMSFKGTWSNKQNPVVLGQIPSWYFGFQDTVAAFERTKTNFKIVGEYSDRFVAPSDTVIKPSCISATFPNIQLIFNGAPKTVVHDTLVATFSDNWGTIVQRTPIDAYTVLTGGYQISSSTNKTIAPFLGSANDTIPVTNLSEFPIQIKNLQLVNNDGGRSFEIASVPGVIASYGSGMIVVTLVDNDKWGDVDDPRRNATLMGTVAGYQTDVTMVDSNFIINLDGAIDVYSPQSTVLNIPPQLKRSIHPRGIIFTSSVSSNEGSGTFIAGYGNDDPVSDYFYLPYYDDPNFSIQIGNFLGLGTLSLPGVLPPDTGFLTGVETLTRFTGDPAKNYLTKLHWPRANDTITIDVLALGDKAPPFDIVTPSYGARSNILLWPNPASQTVRFHTLKTPTVVIIMDQLGRIMKRQMLQQTDVIDVSNFIPGMYEFYFPELQQSAKVQILR